MIDLGKIGKNNRMSKKLYPNDNISPLLEEIKNKLTTNITFDKSNKNFGPDDAPLNNSASYGSTNKSWGSFPSSDHASFGGFGTEGAM